MATPEITGASFYNFLAEGKVMGTRCTKSGELFMPPQPLCPSCMSTQDMEWVEFSGKGKLAAFSVVTVGSTMMIQAGFDFKNPYCAGIVELEEGPKMSGQIFGVDVSKPESIKIGTPVKAKFVERGEGDKKRTYLAFEVA
jgi:hypothetical protein